MVEENITFPISAIEKGVVIDHITAGQAMTIINTLNLTSRDYLIMLGINLPSISMGKKDIIKLENYTLSEDECNIIVVFSPKATVNVIDEYKVFKKLKPELPERIENIGQCPNNRCITNHENIGSLFIVNKHGSKEIHLCCHYCKKEMCFYNFS